jgi:carbon-monoxide dehydrogenase medium subunit
VWVKPPSFDYHRPQTVAEAVALLGELGPDAKVLAGGQSLVPLLNMRLAAPKALVDINRVDDLRTVDANRHRVRIDALIRHSDLEQPGAGGPRPVWHDWLPVLPEAIQCVAHPTIRNRGTSVGSLVHADPAAELPAVLLLCDGSVELRSTAGTRVVAAAEFFVGPLESALRPGELAVAATFRCPPPRSGSAFVELSRRAGDYALAGLALTVTLGADGLISSARAAYLSVGPTPVLVDLTDAVSGSTVDWGRAASLAQSTVEPDDDIHATAAYRAHLVGVLTERAGARALHRARLAASVDDPATVREAASARKAASVKRVAGTARRAAGNGKGTFRG